MTFVRPYSPAVLEQSNSSRAGFDAADLAEAEAIIERETDRKEESL